VLAFEGMNSGKIIVAPAMNNFMYEAKLTQKNLETLKSMGFEIIEPIVGNLACGDSGKGHIAKVNDVVNFIKNL
jgi:phosphopantothenoylcysteine synthetase/decarboxylase